MSTLDEHGQKLLAYLASVLPKVIPGDPRTYVTYKKIHDQLGLKQLGETYGRSLQRQGLNSLAAWTRSEGKPAITGLIIDGTSMMPGMGFFPFFERSESDFGWWADQIRLSKSFDWLPYLSAAPLSEAQTIRSIANKLNAMAHNHPIGELQSIRAKLKGLVRRAGTDIFSAQTIFDDWAFHHGGRSELQFNIGTEELSETIKLRHGVAFSFEPSQALPSIDVLIPKARLFNEFMQLYPENYADMRMWHYQRDHRSSDYPAGLIMPELAVQGTFVFLGKRQPFDRVDYELILSDFDRLLPLFEYVEIGGKELPVAADEGDAFRFQPGFSEKAATTQATLAERQLDIQLRHNTLQYALCKRLASEYGEQNVTDEFLAAPGARIDVALRRSDSEFWYYEIKTALSPRACLREALGQLLEYAYWPRTREATRLVICGESPLDDDGAKYLRRLKERFELPIDYEQIVISSSS